MLESTLTSKGQTTVPKEVRDVLGLKPGDKIRYFPVGDGAVRLLRVKTVAEVAGCLTKYYDGSPKSLEEIDQEVADYLAEKHGVRRRLTGEAAE